MNRFFSFGLFSLMVGCQSCTPPNPTPQPVPPTPPTPIIRDAAPTPPAPAGDIWDQACTNLALLKCPEGADSKCAQGLRNAATQNLSPSSLGSNTGTCIAHAISQSAAKACGFVKCSTQ